MSNKIFITGGGGFLGTEIIKLLYSENYQIINFSRNYYPHLEKYNVTQIKGDLSKKEDIENALTSDIECVIHTASKVGMSGTFQDFYQTNYTGSLNLFHSMNKHGLKKLVYTSTPSVVYAGSDIINGDESLPYPKDHLNHYAHTKRLAEEFLLKSATKDFLVVALRPHLIFGKNDPNLIPRLIKARNENRLKIVGDGNNQVDIIYVENAALAHLLALKKLSPQISGKSYFIGQGPVKLWDFINQLLILNNLPKLEKKVPLKIAYFIGFILENLYKLKFFKSEPPMTRFVALQLGTSHFFSHKQSFLDLGNYHKFSIEESLEKLAANNV